MKRMFVALALLAAGCGREEPAKPAGMDAPAVSTDRVHDVVCGMKVDRATARKLVYEGSPYWFCSEACVAKFQADPKKLAVPCTCGKTSKTCPCVHCGHHHDPCDCGK